MTSRAKFGTLSICFGVLACLMVLGAKHLEPLLIFRRGYALHLLDDLGLVRTPDPGATPEWSVPGIFSISDPVVVDWLVVNALCFAASAKAMCCYAEYRRESTLPMSIGFVFAAIAIMFISFPASLVAMSLEVCVITIVRALRHA